MEYTTLNNGVKMPMAGIGTFLLAPDEAEQLIPHVNLFTYGNEVIRQDNAALTPYGLLHRADYQLMLSPPQEKLTMEMQ